MNFFWGESELHLLKKRLKVFAYFFIRRQDSFKLDFFKNTFEIEKWKTFNFFVVNLENV